jgi:cell wall assembly regulator SMI1
VGPLLTRLDAWLARHRKRFHRNLQPGASVDELHQLSNAIAKYLPAPLSELLSWHNGQGDDYVGYFVDHWLLMSAAKIAAAKGDLDNTACEYGWKKDWVPFLDDDSGNFVILDLSQKVPPVLAYWMGEHTTSLAPSLEAWLADFVTDVEGGKYHEDPERGTFQLERPHS